MVKSTPPRPGRNPKTGVEVEVPGKRRPIFRAGRLLRAKMLANALESPDSAGGAQDGAPVGLYGDLQDGDLQEGGQEALVGALEAGPGASGTPGELDGPRESDDSEEPGGPLGFPESERPR